MPRRVCVKSGLARFVENISVGPHALQADESNYNGGKDAGPDPHELLLAALGACASTTVQMYAERKQWPLHAVHADLSYMTAPQESGANLNNATISGIEMNISFSGDLSDEQRARLLAIAERCPVHRILTWPVKICAKLVGSRSGSSS